MLGLSHAHAADILAVHSYNPAFGWEKEWRAALEAGLPTHDIEHVYLKSKRRQPHAYRESARKAFDRITGGTYDAVVLGDDTATSLLGQRLAEATALPIVFLGIADNPNRYFEGPKLPPTVTGVLERPLLGLNVRLMDSMLPKADKILVLLDHGISGRAAQRQIRDVAAAISGTEIDTRVLRKFQTWKQEVRTAEKRGYDVLVPALYSRQRTDLGKAVPGERVIAWTHAHTDIPLFGFWRFSVGENKAAAGVVLHGREMGEAAAGLVQKALSPSTIPPPMVVQGGQLVVSRSGLDRWNIELSPEMRERAVTRP